MAFVALPIESGQGVPMETFLPVFLGVNTMSASVRPVSIDSLIMAERESLRASEEAWVDQYGGNGVPCSFNNAERFFRILNNPPAAGQTSAQYNAVIREYIGLLAVFACRNLLNLHIEKREIDLGQNSSSPLLRGLGNELASHGGDRVLQYFCIDNRPFAYLYRNIIVPVKDRKLYKKALIPVPFFDLVGETFDVDDILSASPANLADVDSGRLLIKQLLYDFLFHNGVLNSNALFLKRFGAPYPDVFQRILSNCNGLSPISFLSVQNCGNTLVDVLMNAPECPVLPQNLFSDNLLLLMQNKCYKPPCFGEVVYDDERYNVVNPVSKQLCATLSNNSNVLFDDPDGAPDCSGSCPDADGCITCRIRLIVYGVKLTLQKRYSVLDNCKKSDKNGYYLESINMGIDCNVNPCAAIPSIFRRYIVWNGSECIGVSFDQPVHTFPVNHLGDEATVAIVEPNVYLPKFAFLDYYGDYCGCIPFPAPLNPTYKHLNVPTSIFLDLGATNSVCLVEYGGMHFYVDIKEYVTMVTGEDREFRIFHLLSDRDNNSIVRNMAVCSVEANHYNSSLYRAHAINGGKTAIQYIVDGISSDAPLDLASVNVSDKLSWVNDIIATEGYRAIVGSIFSSAFAKLLELGFDPNLASISISVPDSFDMRETALTRARVVDALWGIGCQHTIQNQYYESSAAATYCIKEQGAGVMLGNFLNVGMDIGGGSIDLFSFRSSLAGVTATCTDSVSNAAGRKILVETVVKAVQYYHARNTDNPDPYSNPFFECFDPASRPHVSLHKASERTALTIAETFIPEAKFNEMPHGTTLHILNTFRRNVLLKTIAVLNYVAEFVKASWKTDEQGNPMDFSHEDVNIILCGNGSDIFSEKWAGITSTESERIIGFLQKRIGCRSLSINKSAQPKKEVVLGMKHIEANGAVSPLQGSFASLTDPVSFDNNDFSVVMEYAHDLLNDMYAEELLRVSRDLDDITPFISVLKREVAKDNKIGAALHYALNHDDVHHKGDRLFLADVFLRLVLELPYIDV